MNISSIFQNDLKELGSRSFYYSKRLVEGDFNVINPHTHNHYALYYLLQGSRKFFIKNRFYLLNPGDFVITKPNTIHYTMSADSDIHERVMLNFTDDIILSKVKPFAQKLCDTQHIIIPDKDRSLIEELLEKISCEYRNSDKYSSVLEGLLLNELLTAVLRIQNANTPTDSPDAESGTEFDKIIEYINNNLNTNISLDDVAAFSNFSKSHFSRIFKKMTGVTFLDYLQLQRVNKAKKMLEQTQFSITEIANECGFSSSGYFATVFKRYFGTSPLSFRKQA